MRELKTETIVSKVRRYVGVPTAMSQEEHEKLHSKLLDSSSEHPHSFFFHPIRETLDDLESPVVGMIASGVAWDFSLLNLLPDGVRGITAVISNTCNQTFTVSSPLILGQGLLLFERLTALPSPL